MSAAAAGHVSPSYIGGACHALDPAGRTPGHIRCAAAAIRQRVEKIVRITDA